MIIKAEIKQCVAFLFAKRPSGKFQAIGTGFFASVPSEGQKYQFIYFVTAKHVLLVDPKKDQQQMLESVFARLNVRNYQAGQGKPGARLIEIPSKDSAGVTPWVFHEDPAIDVAVLPWAPDQKVFEWKSIPVAMFARNELLSSEQVSEGDEIFFTGLLVQHFGEQRNYPVVRFGRIALMTQEKISTELGYSELHVVECQSFPGNSGSPVFLVLGPLRKPGVLGGTRVLFLGIMHGFFPQAREIIEARQTTSKLYSLENIGVALVVPADKLAEVLYGERLVQLGAQAENQAQSRSEKV